MTSAVLAAFLTNPLEVIVVNSQTNKEYKWFKELTSPKKLAKIWFVGIRMRCLYYAIQAFPFFFIFEINYFVYVRPVGLVKRWFLAS